MKPASIVVLVLFVIGLAISLMVLVFSSPTRHVPEMELALLWLRQAVGMFITVVAALAILIRCLNGKRIDEVLGLVIALFAGLAVIAAEWPLTVTLGVIVVGYLVKEIVELFRAKNAIPDAR